ncbi:hypothetical protein P7K49_013510, partial [Saguinus oedipus]
ALDKPPPRLFPQPRAFHLFPGITACSSSRCLSRDLRGSHSPATSSVPFHDRAAA